MCASFSFPSSVAPLYTDECISRRQKLNRIIRQILNYRIKNQKPLPNQLQNLEPIINKTENVIVPYSHLLNKLYSPFDLVSLSGIVNGKTFMLMGLNPNGSSIDAEVGKTALGLGLLGMNIPYGQIPDTVERVKEKGPWILKPEGERETKILSTDMCYIGAGRTDNEKFGLYIASSISEIGWAQWDLARHIFRVNNLREKYKSRIAPEAIDFLMRLAEHLWISPEVFASNDKLYPLDSIFLIERKNFNDKTTVKIDPVADEWRELKKVLLKNPLYNEAKFWKINYAVHRKVVDDIINKIDYCPQIFNVFISAKKGPIPIYEATKELKHYLR